jgi:hypothetical protein
MKAEFKAQISFAVSVAEQEGAGRRAALAQSEERLAALAKQALS